MLTWILMDESVESEEPPPTITPEPLEEGLAGRPWPAAKPRP
jgi:hypothetical protein